MKLAKQESTIGSHKESSMFKTNCKPLAVKLTELWGFEIQIKKKTFLEEGKIQKKK